MTERHLRTTTLVRIILAAITCVEITAACAFDDAQRAPATSQVSPAARGTTCVETILGFVPDGLHLGRRDLVPYSPTTRGITKQYEPANGGDDRTITVVSGGFLDEVTEAYDNLEVGPTRVLLGQRLNVMIGSVLDTPVRVVIWRLDGTESPCDVQAIVATNLSETEFDLVLDGVRLG
jgi:hypothetical protein